MNTPNFIKRDDFPLPERYKVFLTAKDYNQIIRIALECLQKLDCPVQRIDEGDIVVLFKEQEAHCYLDNLVKRIAPLSSENRVKEIERHFRQLRIQPEAYDYFYKDFDHAKQYLKVLVRPVDTTPNPEEYVYRVDFPGTHTYLVFDFDHQFNYVRRDRIDEWGMPVEDLFHIALSHISRQQVQTREYLLGDRFPLFLLFNANFSASFAIELEKNLRLSAGNLGCLVAIPAKNIALVHCIEGPQVLQLMALLFPEVLRIFQDCPGGISTDFYWYRKGHFEPFPQKPIRENELTIHLPQKLALLLNQN